MKDEVERLRIRVDKAWNERQKCRALVMHTNGKNKEAVRQKFRLLDDKYWLLRDRLDYYDGISIIEDDEIAIKRFGDDIENRYLIYLKKGIVKVGGIDYQGYHKSLLEGDIGYFIYDKYRGSNYAYKALCLLSNYLYENKIMDFYISVFHDNDASIKTIKKYGGNVVYQDQLLTTYQCETRKREKDHNL